MRQIIIATLLAATCASSTLAARTTRAHFGAKGKGGQLYRMGDAIVMEPQIFPDAMNQPGFPSIRLNPGQTYRNIMTYRLFTQKG